MEQNRRMIEKETIVLSSADFYIPKTGLEEDNFDWEVFGDNMFDEINLSLTSELGSNSIYVGSVFADNMGGLVVGFDNGYRMEVIPDSSQNIEFWRFFRSDSESAHFVVFED